MMQHHPTRTVIVAILIGLFLPSFIIHAPLFTLACAAGAGYVLARRHRTRSDTPSPYDQEDYSACERESEDRTEPEPDATDIRTRLLNDPLSGVRNLWD